MGASLADRVDLNAAHEAQAEFDAAFPCDEDYINSCSCYGKN